MKKDFLIIFVINTLLTVIAKIPYRLIMEIYNIHDFGLSGSLPSFFYVIGLIFCMFYFYDNKNLKSAFSQIMFITLGCLAYELMQPLMHNMIFDVKDVLATVLGGFISLLLYLCILRKHAAKVSAESSYKAQS